MKKASYVHPDPLFSIGQRVRVLPCHHFPPTSRPGGIRYGAVVGGTSCAGCYVVNKDAGSRAPSPTNAEGEWAYLVRISPGGGALWFTAEGLQSAKRKETK